MDKQCAIVQVLLLIFSESFRISREGALAGGHIPLVLLTACLCTFYLAFSSGLSVNLLHDSFGQEYLEVTIYASISYHHKAELASESALHPAEHFSCLPRHKWSLAAVADGHLPERFLVS